MVSGQVSARTGALAARLKAKMPVRDSSSAFNRMIRSNSLVFCDLFSSSLRTELISLYDLPAQCHKNWATIHVVSKMGASHTSLVTSFATLLTVQFYSSSSHDCANVAIFSQFPS